MSAPSAEHSQEDLAHADIGIVHALAIEVQPFLDRCQRLRHYTNQGFPFRGGKYDGIRVAFAECGMGFARAREATQRLIADHSPRWVLSVGFSGGLSPEMRTGDIVIANALVDQHGQQFQVDLNMPADPARGLHVGRTLTADALVRTADEKKRFADQYSAIAVDLESLAVAQVCQEMHTRFVSVRVISDDAASDLPPEILSVVGPTGAVRYGAVLGALWNRPGSATDLWKLRESATKAASRLATFLDGVVVQLNRAS